jgi:hypothetical protein
MNPLTPDKVEQYLITAANGRIVFAWERLGNIYFYGLKHSALSGNRSRVPIDFEKSRKAFASCSNDAVIGQSCAVGMAHAQLAIYSDRGLAIKTLESAHAFGELWGMFYFGADVPRDKSKAADYLSAAKQLLSDERSSGTRAVLRYADAIEAGWPAGGSRGRSI